MLSWLSNENVKVVAAALGGVAAAVHTLTPAHTKANKASVWLLKVLGGVLGVGAVAG